MYPIKNNQTKAHKDNSDKPGDNQEDGDELYLPRQAVFE